MAATATRVLNVARSQLGYHATVRKINKFGAWYGMNGQNWCDMFVSWVANTSNARDIIGRCAYTPSHAQWFKSEGRWGDEPRRGAIVFYEFPEPGERRINHVGIVEKVLSARVIQTIEGNTVGPNGYYGGGGVFRRTRATTFVAGYGYPKYAAESNVTPMNPNAAGRGNNPPLIVDGQWGRLTTRALQRWLGVSDDGQIGADTRRALNKKLGLPAPPVWNRATHKGLQHALGVNEDGDWGPVTNRALQRKLNNDWRR